MLQKASVLISKTSKRTRDSVSKKAPFLGLVAFPPGFEPGAFRLGGGRSILLSYGNLLFGCVGWRVYLHYLRSYDERLPQRIMASHLFPKTPYVTGILEIALPTQSHAIPWNS